MNHAVRIGTLIELDGNDLALETDVLGACPRQIILLTGAFRGVGPLHVIVGRVIRAGIEDLALFFIDGIANAMINPVFLLSAGGLNGLIGTMAEPKAVPGQMANLLRPKRGARKFSASPSVGGIS